MSRALRIAVLLIPVVLAALAIREQRKPEAVSPIGLEWEAAEQDAPVPPGGYRSGYLEFTFWAGAALSVAIIARNWLVPVVGDFFSNALFGGGEGADDPRVKARLLAEDGNFGRALALLARASREYPDDRTIPADMARIHLEELDDASSAIQVLETALTRDWRAEDRAWLLTRLANVRHEGADDFDGARELLMRAISIAPGTREAEAARNRLLELEDLPPPAPSSS